VINLTDYWEKGISYPQYLLNFKSELDQGPVPRNQHNYNYVKLNWSRTNRLTNQAGLVLDFDSIDLKDFRGICITEHWCGDAAQNLPFINLMCRASGIDLRILYRDENPELMNAYLTNGSKSIPIVIIFDENGDEIFHWGPRPVPAQNMLKEYKLGSLSKDEFNIQVQKWYNTDEGKTLQKEWYEMMKR